MSGADLARQLEHDLTSVYDRYTELFTRFSDEQVNVVPFEGSWTAGQVADHIIKATKRIPDRETADAGRAFDEKVPVIETIFLDFNTKFKSPEFVLPSTGMFEKHALLETFNTLRTRHSEDIMHTDLEKLCLNFELPAVGTLTRYEWYRFFVVHGVRHLRQLNNIFDVLNQ